ncbi:MAG: hypothetical protein P9F75_10000 [Candidatus Contendobacter sp.]|nr:hypothetical protein [Candidatus Contendobacter sp.]
MLKRFAILVLASWLASACVSPEEQQAANVQRCSDFGFTMGTMAFANCMISTATQSDTQQAAILSQRTARDAEEARARQARDRADQDAWDRRTGQGIYATPSATPNQPTRSDHSKSECHKDENTTTLPDGTVRMTSNEHCSSSSF